MPDRSPVTPLCGPKSLNSRIVADPDTILAITRCAPRQSDSLRGRRFSRVICRGVRKAYSIKAWLADIEGDVRLEGVRRSVLRV
jgi:hypothetical protein